MWTDKEEKEYQESRQRESERISNGYRRRGNEDAAQQESAKSERHSKAAEKAKTREEREA